MTTLGDLPGIDMVVALKNVGGNIVLLRKILIDFLHDHQDDAQAIRRALDGDDLLQAQRIAHTLKGMSLSIGATALHSRAKALDAALQKNATDHYPNLLDILEAALASVANTLARLGGHSASRTTAEPPAGPAYVGATERDAGGAIMNPAAALGKKSRVLIVDDERLTINLLSDLLKSDCKIIVATSGEQAIEIATAAKPDLILLDIMMPGMDGFEVCRQLKAQSETQRIPIIFITAKGDVESETMGFAVGAVDYISKPFNSAVVQARVGVHMKLRRQSDLLENLASIDALTEIPNRRAYDHARKQEWARSLRTGLPISFVMIDIDMFKQFNDNYGHDAGDDCLVRIARTLFGCAQRPGDFLGRYGGEEFAAVLSNTDVDDAAYVVERCHAAVAALHIPHARSTVAPHVTISVGIATVVPTADLTPEMLSETADKMLYAAKGAGRNTTKGMWLQTQMGVLRSVGFSTR